jgi:hypothetical protein
MAVITAATPVHAQRFVEIGAGPTFFSSPPAAGPHAVNADFRASLGWSLSNRTAVRWDLTDVHLQHRYHVVLSCPYVGCSFAHALHARDLVGLTVNGIVNLDAGGHVFVIGGAGVYGENTLDAGLIGGAGLLLPLPGGVHWFLEGRYALFATAVEGRHGLLPITTGIRF